MLEICFALITNLHIFKQVYELLKAKIGINPPLNNTFEYKEEIDLEMLEDLIKETNTENEFNGYFEGESNDSTKEKYPQWFKTEQLVPNFEDCDTRMTLFDKSEPIELDSNDWMIVLRDHMPDKMLNRKRYRRMKKKKLLPGQAILFKTGEQFIYKERDKSLYEGKSKISIVSYNILNQIYMKKPNSPELSEENRMKSILKELKSLNADVIFLQEADVNVYNLYIMPGLKDYQVYYGVNCGSSFINIIAFKKFKYKMVSFRNFSLYGMNTSGNRGMMNIVIENLGTNEKFSLYNVHLPWKSEGDRFKMVKMMYSHMLEMDIENVITAGDFNSIPNSDLIKLFYFAYYQHKEIKEKDLDIYRTIYQKYSFRSAYENYTKGHRYFLGHPEFTTRTQYFKDTIDYVFYSKYLKPIRILKLPRVDEVEFEGGFLPSSFLPSDHVKIYAEFSLEN